MHTSVLPPAGYHGAGRPASCPVAGSNVACRCHVVTALAGLGSKSGFLIYGRYGLLVCHCGLRHSDFLYLVIKKLRSAWKWEMLFAGSMRWRGPAWRAWLYALAKIVFTEHLWFLATLYVASRCREVIKLFGNL